MSFDEYRLIKALGRGGMGQVWLAHDTVLDRPVAVKFIAALSAHDAVHQRFLIEARAAARVQHPNIIAIYRVGEIGPRPYLISEYVRGESLDKIARPVAWPRLLEIAIGLARGLAAAHGCGVLHRDLKPANAIVSETGEVKLLDFGLAKLMPHVAPRLPDAPPDREPAVAPPSILGELMATPPARSGWFEVPSDPNVTTEVASGAEARAAGGGLALPSITHLGAVMGTPAYMPPEAWRGEPATPRSDVYSLGALLYELGAGTPPHRGGSPKAVRERALATDAPPLATAAPGIDPGFAAIVDRCLRRDPAERFASGEAVREALEALAAGDATRVKALARPPQERRSSRVLPAVFSGVALALALVLLLLLAYQRGDEERADLRAGAAAVQNVLPDVPAPDSADAAGSRSIGAVGPCPAEMVPVPAGTFLMGSPKGQGETDEQPQHEVSLSAYCIDRTEVTVADHAACVAAGRCSAAPLTTNLSVFSAREAKRYSQLCNRGDRPDHPINCVDWEQAAAYCAWRGKRLPTEAEWEYAARGGDGRAYPWGDEAPDAKRLNMCGVTCETLARRESLAVATMLDGNTGWETTPVGRYPEGQSPFGALDMAGNVAEWTADWYGSYAEHAETNPRGPSWGTSRVTRGGGWALIHTHRAADRDWPDPTDRAIDLGFRCARGR